jgi:hypothetical protein
MLLTSVFRAWLDVALNSLRPAVARSRTQFTAFDVEVAISAARRAVHADPGRCAPRSSRRAKDVPNCPISRPLLLLESSRRFPRRRTASRVRSETCNQRDENVQVLEIASTRSLSGSDPSRDLAGEPIGGGRRHRGHTSDIVNRSKMTQTGHSPCRREHRRRCCSPF